MVADAACHGSRRLVVAEDGSPARELEVRGDHERLALVALRYDLEGQPRPVGAEGNLDGYYLVVTSETDWEDSHILDAYRELWRIEESFRVTKTGGSPPGPSAFGPGST